MPESIERYYERLEDKFEKYKGIPSLCVPGLHASVLETVQELAPKGARLLDVGCGRGALSLRLADAGFDVEACDLFDLFEPRDRVRFVHGAAEEVAHQFSGQYDVVLLVELLQAVQSPMGLIREYARFIKPGGHLLITVPNVEDDLSRAEFFLRSRHKYFESHNVRDEGSITPVHDFQIRHYFEDLGIDLVERRSLLPSDPPKVGATWAALHLLRSYQKASGIAPDNGKIAMWIGTARTDA